MADAGTRRALIMAGAGGIGAVLAECSIAAGYDVTVTDRDSAVGEALAARIGCCFLLCDLADEAAIDRVVATTGAVNLLVNNGGISGPTAPVQALDPQMWRALLDVNLTAPFLACRAMIPLMLAAGQGGSVVNMSSVAARIGYRNRAAYAASKAGVLGLTAALAREVGRHGIRVNAILPATTRGKRIDQVLRDYAAATALSPEEARDRFLGRHATGALVEPEDIADMILFLAGPAGRSITGQFIGIDGGFE
ncbi:SDR family oxidoreductase [Sphingomonas naphthae]|uniref:SDR family oxidoreductase n=1 Tax=Sphingomonas naphthae TaxID=1813468 RepID=A0ABY7TNA9_9SPHN|nr:SDR family oxidoreductase [Sphingomonas naphthae]WCT74466.1 SDR family oxidoreductase [Sphingomonas naphthae]